MSKSFEVNPRQVRNTPSTLPNNTAYSQFAKALGTAADFAGEIGVQQSVEKAAIQGAQERIDGKKRDLAPGYTKATRSYNEAYANMDKNIIFAETSARIAQAKIDATAPGKFKPGVSINEFTAKSNAEIDQAVRGSLPQNQPALAFELKKNQANDQLQIQAYENDYVFKKAQEVDKATRSSLLRDASNAAQEGNEELTKEFFDKLVSQLHDSVATGFYTKEEADNYLEEVKGQITAATFKGEGERAALAAPGYAEQRMLELAAEIDSLGLPADIKDIALKSFMEGVSLKRSAMQSQQAVNVAQAQYDILNGGITTHADIDSVEGLTKLQQLGLHSALQKQLNKQDNTVAAINSFRENAFQDTGHQTGVNAKVKEAALAQDLITKQQDLAAQTNNPAASLTPMDVAKIVATYHTNFPSWDAEQTAAILSGDYNRAKPYLDSYQYQKNYAIDEKKSSSVGITGDALSVADMYTQRATKVADAATAYYQLMEGVKNKDSQLRQDRIKFFDHEIKAPLKRKAFQAEFGVSADKSADAYANWLNISRDSFGKWGQAYTEQVFSSAADQMKGRWQTDRYAPDGELKLNPITAVSDLFEYNELGNNFVFQAVYEMCQRNKALPPELRDGQVIEWGMPQPFPSQLSEQDMVSKNIPWHLSVEAGKEPNIYTYGDYKDRAKPPVFVNGKRAEVVFNTGGFTVQGPRPVATLGLLVDGEVIPWMDPTNKETGLATVVMPEAKRLIPNVIANLSETQEQAQARAIAEKSVPQPTPSKLIGQLGAFKLEYGELLYPLTPTAKREKGARERAVEKETKNVRKELKNKRTSVKAELEKGL